MDEVNPFRGSVSISAISGILGIFGEECLIFRSIQFKFPQIPQSPHGASMGARIEHASVSLTFQWFTFRSVEKFTAPSSPNSPSKIGESTEKPLKSQG